MIKTLEDAKKEGVLENHIYNADCLDVMRLMKDKCVDLILTDPPYGIEFQSNHRLRKYEKIKGDDKYPIEVIYELKRLAKRAIYIFCRWDNLKDLPYPKSFLVWVKNNWSMGDLLHEHGRQWEGIAFYPQEGHEFLKRIPDVINSNRTGNNLHPTEKPVDLIKKIIQANVGDLIFDPFLGSGTTAVAAKQLKRNFIGIEISEKYCEIARGRLRQEILL